MDGFTPLSATLGGLMMGASAALLLLLNGRIAGISGIVGGLLGSSGREAGWRVAFLVGLLLGPILFRLAAGHGPDVRLGAPLDAFWPVLVIAGLLVGYGTRLGSGCTSGHGVCGLSRLSRRSLVATALFMASGFATVAAMRLTGTL